MTDTGSLPALVRRILMTEEAIYGLILVSGLIVVSNNLAGTSLNALLTVIVTVLVFFAAHVYAGTISRLAAERGDGKLRASLIAALHHSEGMLLVSLAPVVILLLGVLRVIDDEVAIWGALTIDTLILGVLGWFAVARWTPRLWPRLGSALLTAAFGGVIILLKSLIHR